MTLLTEQDQFILLNEQNTALAMVCLHPEIAHRIPEHYDEISSYLIGSSTFGLLTNAITDDLSANGFIAPGQGPYASLIGTLAVELLATFDFSSGTERDVEPSPSLRAYVNTSEPVLTDLLTYNHDGINIGYAIRGYQNGLPISETKLFQGDEHPTLDIDNAEDVTYTWHLNNLMMSLLQTDISRFVVNPVPDFGRDAFTVSELDLDDVIGEVQFRVTNGEGLNQTSEDDLAEDYNTFIFIRTYLTGWFPGSWLKSKMSLAPACAVELSQGGLALREQSREASATPASLTLSGANLTATVADCLFEQGSLKQKVAAFAGALSGTVGALFQIGFLSQFIYDQNFQEEKLVYTYTKLGSNFTGKLSVVSNNTGQYIGIPGSLTTVSPQIDILERPLVVHRPAGSVIYEADPQPIIGSGLDLKFLGVSLNTESVQGPDGVSYPGGNFSLGTPIPITSSENIFQWKLRNAATAPEESTMNVSIALGSDLVVLPNSIEGYGEASITFTADVEMPVLVQGVDPQVGTPNNPLPLATSVQLTTTSGVPIANYPYLYFETAINSGTMLSSWGQFGTELPVLTDALGMASVQWTLGEASVQNLSVYVSPSGESVLAEVEFEAKGPPVILQEHLPQPGDVIFWNYSDVNTEIIPTPASDSAQFWNYSGLFGTTTSSTTTWIDPIGLLGADLFTEANIAAVGGGFTEYWSSGPQGFKEEGGFGQDAYSTSYAICDNSIFVPVPFTYGSNVSSNGARIAINTPVSQSPASQEEIVTTRVHTGDAYGIITTPAFPDGVEVLRMRMDDASVRNRYVDSTGTGNGPWLLYDSYSYNESTYWFLEAGTSLWIAGMYDDGSDPWYTSLETSGLTREPGVGVVQDPSVQPISRNSPFRHRPPSILPLGQ